MHVYIHLSTLSYACTHNVKCGNGICCNRSHSNESIGMSNQSTYTHSHIHTLTNNMIDSLDYIPYKLRVQPSSHPISSWSAFEFEVWSMKCHVKQHLILMWHYPSSVFRRRTNTHQFHWVSDHDDRFCDFDTETRQIPISRWKKPREFEWTITKKKNQRNNDYSRNFDSEKYNGIRFELMHIVKNALKRFNSQNFFFSLHSIKKSECQRHVHKKKVCF